MIPRTSITVNQNVSGIWGKRLFFSLALLLTAYLILGSPVSAGDTHPKNSVGSYTKEGETYWIIPGGEVDVIQGNYTPGELEALLPMTKQAEKAIVHRLPPCPLIVDGITHQARDIALFNGTRLRFIIGDDGALYAFTTAEGLEKFMAQQTTPRGGDPLISVFHKDWLLRGDALILNSQSGIPNLSLIGFDNSISSTRIGTLCSWACLYDDFYFGGDSFYMLPGSEHQALTFEGWNDRASSVYVN